MYDGGDILGKKIKRFYCTVDFLKEVIGRFYACRFFLKDYTFFLFF